MIARRAFLPGLTGVLLAVPLFAASAADEGAQVETFGLKYRAMEKWDVILPEEQWTSFEDEIPIGDGFITKKVGPLGLEVDTNADGKLDEKVRGVKGFLKLRGKNEDGESYNYAIRLKGDGKVWRFAPGGAMVGKLKGTLVKVFDQNNNGLYDDYGTDAMIVGKGGAAGLLSKVVNASGTLYNFEISADGTQASFSPFEGETASIDVCSDYDSRGKLIAAVISSEDGEHHFNAAAGGKKAFLVPAGAYTVSSGYVTKAGESVHMRTGKMAPFTLKAGQNRDIEWGGPVIAEFDYTVEEETVTVPPNVAFYGRAGEEYHTFWPEAKSPKIIVTDKKTNKVLTSGRFGGC
ncbi:MAG: hypothetical protein VYE81_05700 [Planctomycetota bacterium]|nr:hypothetical protein [Planctomycetota bacterium]